MCFGRVGRLLRRILRFSDCLGEGRRSSRAGGTRFSEIYVFLSPSKRFENAIKTLLNALESIEF